MESMATTSALSLSARSRARALLPEPVGPVRIRAWSKASGLMRWITDHRPGLAKISHAGLRRDTAASCPTRQPLRILAAAGEPGGADAAGVEHGDRGRAGSAVVGGALGGADAALRVVGADRQRGGGAGRAGARRGRAARGAVPPLAAGARVDGGEREGDGGDGADRLR